MARSLKTVFLSLALAMAAGEGAAASNILFVLDSSNSMWGQVEGTAKAETARAALSDLVAGLPDDATLGLMLYGHRDKSACDDVELVLPLGTANADSMRQALGGIRPTGKTPIAFALERAGEAFGDVSEADAKSIVLVSDGVETCEGDPCTVAEKLAAAAIDVRVHVVGFDISEDDRAALECIAEKGKGRYFAADSTEGFRDAVTQAVQVAQVSEEEPEPEPEPVAKVVFEDEFDGEGLSEEWAVTNPDPDAFIVEAGKLLLLNNKVGSFPSPDAQNIIALEHDLPDGDWDAHLTFTGEFTTGRDSLNFGLYRDPENYLTAQLWTKKSCCGCSNYVLTLAKKTAGDPTSSDHPVKGGLGCGSMNPDKLEAELEKLTDTPATLALHKRGRSYHASLTLGENDEQGNPIVYETDVLTSLRSPGELAITAGKWEEKESQGEILVMIDSVKIVSVKE